MGRWVNEDRAVVVVFSADTPFKAEIAHLMKPWEILSLSRDASFGLEG